jgi:hypothetical protein
MRTAAEIIKSYYPFYNPDIENKDVELNGESVQKLINEARKEAIEYTISQIQATVITNGTHLASLINEVK